MRKGVKPSCGLNREVVLEAGVDAWTPSEHCRGTAQGNKPYWMSWWPHQWCSSTFTHIQLGLAPTPSRSPWKGYTGGKKGRTAQWVHAFISQCKRALNLNSMFSNSLLRFCSTLLFLRNCFLKVQETEFSEPFKKRGDVRVYMSSANWSETGPNWSCKTPSTSH